MAIEFILFGCLLLGIAIFHERTLEVAIVGTTLILIYKVVWSQLGILDHLAHESHLLINLFGLLLGFALLSKHFEESRVPEWLSHRLPKGWTGGLCLLAIVAGISTFLDNIAGAMIGGVIARRMYRQRVSLSFIVALVAASNAGGAGSVIGDTTTTMMWISGVPAAAFLKAFIASAAAIAFFGVVASRSQHAFQPAVRTATMEAAVDVGRLSIVALIVVGTIAANLAFDFPAAGLWAGLLIGALIRQTPWGELRHAYTGSVFLVLLVLSASFMPVHRLPSPTWQSALGLGFVSAVFDNIPLTALAIYQGGYDWGVLAYTVGFGGSLTWFGSSAGVAISNIFPQAKSTLDWLKEGWHVGVAYVLGFFLLLALAGWNP
jgi:Na+/H+ antiporter NhaD/arsenite permease-like protein